MPFQINMCLVQIDYFQLNLCLFRNPPIMIELVNYCNAVAKRAVLQFSGLKVAGSISEDQKSGKILSVGTRLEKGIH